MVGSQVARRADLVARIAAEGHEVGSHSWAHGRHRRAGPALAVDLARTSIAIRRAAGAYPRWFRPPYAHWTPGMVRAARLAGMRTATWDVDPRDWEAGDAATVAERVRRSTEPGSILLLHEGSGGVALEALPEILGDLRDRALATVTLSDLLARE